MGVAESFPKETRVVVIGAGALGCSTAYHLAKYGAGDVVLLERGKVSCGTTWHSAAHVRQLRSSLNLTELIKYSVSLYRELEDETGQSTGWRQTGSLSIATNSDRLTHIRRQSALARAFGVETHEVSPAEAKSYWPLLNVDDIIRAVFSPSDGRVNPSDLCLALTKGARTRGVKIFEDCRVTAIETGKGRVKAVITPNGRIACEAVAVTAGLWSRQVAAMAGVSCPLYACEHFYLLTDTIEGVTGHLPTLGDHDAHLYMRDDVGGLLVGSFEPIGKPIAVSDLPKDFTFDLLNEDWAHFEPMLKNAIHRIPALETANARLLLNGPESFTPDGSPLVGETPELRGLYLGCGMNSMGLASSGGVGHVLARWIIDGKPPMDLWSLDARRMATDYNSTNVLRARVSEVLGLHFAISFPGREYQTSRNIVKSPLHDELAERGARFTERFAWERAAWFAPRGESVDETLTFGRPGWFARVEQEHRRVREAVGLIDQSSFGKILIEGPDAEAFLQYVCANDLAVAPGRIVYTPALNDRAGYEADFTVQRLANDRYLVVSGTTTIRRDMSWFDRHRDSRRVKIKDVTREIAVIGVTGPQSRALLGRLSSHDFSNASFPYYTWHDVEIGATMVRAARLSYAGELGWELYMPSSDAVSMYRKLLLAGSDLRADDVGVFAMASLRIEMGYRAWGHELTPDDNPVQAGLVFATKVDKQAAYFGQEALKRRVNEQADRRLVTLVAKSVDANPIGGEPILQNGQVVGQVTSACFGHTVGRAVCLGYVVIANGNVENTLRTEGYSLDVAGKPWEVRVSMARAYDPHGQRVRA